MLWDGHSFDKDVKTSAVDRGYTTYSDEYIKAEAEKVNYEFQDEKRAFRLQKMPKKLLKTALQGSRKRFDEVKDFQGKRSKKRKKRQVFYQNLP